MKLKIKDIDIGTGGVLVAIMNGKDAAVLDLHAEDRIRIKNGKSSAVAILDIAESSKVVPSGRIGLFEEVLSALNLKDGAFVSVAIENKPKSITLIKKKLSGETLSDKEINLIVEDIVEHRLTDVELTYFVSACHTNLLNLKETVALTKAMIHNGEILKLNTYPVVDKHCAGGVAGNRTTMVVVPIVAAAGLVMPKTSSRSITSPAGTADTMEVLAKVAFPLKKMRDIVKKVGACIVWGGAINLAPADDRIIKVEHPLSIDTRGQLLASIIAKKASVSATHVLVDIPITPQGKTQTRRQAEELKEQFIIIGKKVGMKIEVVITDGLEPIGKGLGPALEARDVLHTLMNTKEAPKDLKRKSIMLAGKLIEMGGKCKKGKGVGYARELLGSGKALSKMKEIIKAQGGNPDVMPEDIKIGKYKQDIRAEKNGVLHHMDNHVISKIARLAGAPNDKGAGVFLHKHKGDKLKKGDVVMTLYANSSQRLKFAKEMQKEMKSVFFS